MDMMNPHPRHYYTRKSLSAALLISESTIKRCEKTGDLKATHLGPRIVRYNARDVEEFLRRRGKNEPPNP
jgi:predicted DNA-binding transcriptional regulator AlpA